MLLPTAATIYFIVSFVIYEFKIYPASYYDATFYMALILVLFGVGATIFCLGSIPSFIIGYFLPKKWAEIENCRLLRISDTNISIPDIDFFLGIGKRSGSRAFLLHFIKKDKDGCYWPQTLNATKRTFIYEEGRRDGVFKAYEWKFTKRIFYLFAFTFPFRKYEFFIPVGGRMPLFKFYA